MHQPDLFSQQKQSNYAFETSLPAFYSHPEAKEPYEKQIFNVIYNECMQVNPEPVTLLWIQEKLAEKGVLIEQAKVSARIDGLRKKNLVRYTEEKFFYKGFKRKTIRLIK